MVVSEHEGAWKFKCFGCGKSGDCFDVQAMNENKSVEEIIAGLEPRTNTQKPKKPDVTYPDLEKLDAAVRYIYCSSGGVLEASYQYRHPETKECELVVFRIKYPDRKSFVQASQLNGVYVLRNVLAKNPIYNRTMVSKSDSVVVVEGEKKVHCLRALGIVATCSPGGANAATKADWSWLAGKKVTIWPDNDDAGEKYAEALLAELRILTPRPSVRLVDVEPLNLGPKDDVVDFCERYPMLDQKIEAVMNVLASARSTGAIFELEQEYQDTFDGKRYPVPFEWPTLNDLTCALAPGCVTVLCGSPGGTKSLLVLQQLRFMLANGVKASLYAFEDGVVYQLRRVLAQICRERLLTNDIWCRNNMETVKQHIESARAELAAIEPAIEAPKDRTCLSAKSLAEWVQRKCDNGTRVIIIDPITMMAKGKFGFLDDEEFLYGAKHAIEAAKASLLVVTHPRKAKQGDFEVIMDDLAGGASYSRFSQCIMYLQAHEMRSENVKTSFGVTEASCDRTMIIFKARNAAGHGKKIGFEFDPASLTLSEKGEYSVS